MPADIRRAQQNESKDIVRPLFAFLDHGRREALLKPLPDDVLVSLAITPFNELANKQQWGLIALDKAVLEKVIEACWDAVSL